VASAAFTALAADTASQQDALGRVRYCTRIRGDRVEVSRYQGEADYSAEVLRTFERFKQGAVTDYRIGYRMWPGINHVTAEILELVARLFPEEFGGGSRRVCAGARPRRPAGWPMGPTLPAGYVRGLRNRGTVRTAAYLGNLWRPRRHDDGQPTLVELPERRQP